MVSMKHIWMILLLGIFIPNVSVAQTISDTQSQIEQNQFQQDKFLEQQRLLEQERQIYEKKKEEFRKEKDKEKSKKAEGNCTRIEEIQVIGNESIKLSSDIEDQVEFIENSCSTKNHWANLKTAIMNEYINEGYISSRVYFDFSKIQQKIIILKINEGKLEKILIQNKSGKRSIPTTWRERNNIYMAFPMYDEKVINLHDMEQGIDQINRLKSNHMKMSLEPGQSNGYSVLVLQNQKTEGRHIAIGYDNFGSESTGKNQGNISYTHDDLLGLNDQFSLYGSHDLEGNDDNKGSQSYNINYSLPFGYWTFTAGYSYSDYISSSVGMSGLIHFSGKTTTQRYTADRIISRGRRHKISLYNTMNIKDKKSYLEDLQLENGSYDLTINDFGLTWTEYLDRGLFYTKTSYNKALPWFNSTQYTDGNIYDPKDDFEIGKLYAYLSQNFKMFNHPFYYNVSLDSQYTQNRLFSSEQFFIGGIGSVRGFQEVAYSGESGAVVRQDVKTDFLINGLKLGMFIDAGYSNSIDNGEYTISGSGVELSFYNKYFDITGTYAQPVDKNNLINLERDVFYITGKFRFSF